MRSFASFYKIEIFLKLYVKRGPERWSMQCLITALSYVYILCQHLFSRFPSIKIYYMSTNLISKLRELFPLLAQFLI